MGWGLGWGQGECGVVFSLSSVGGGGRFGDVVCLHVEWLYRHHVPKEHCRHVFSDCYPNLLFPCQCFPFMYSGGLTFNKYVDMRLKLAYCGIVGYVGTEVLKLRTSFRVLDRNRILFFNYSQFKNW